MVLELPSRGGNNESSDSDNDSDENIVNTDLADDVTKKPHKSFSIKRNNDVDENEPRVNSRSNDDVLPPLVEESSYDSCIETILSYNDNEIGPPVSRSKHDDDKEEIDEMFKVFELKDIRKYKLNSNEPLLHTIFPRFVSLNNDIPQITSETFLAALREEGGIRDPDALHKNCYDAMNALKINHILDKYILCDDEAAVLCAISILLDDGFPIQKMVESCEDKAPSNLLLMILLALRKLPRYKGIMYFSGKRKKEFRKRVIGDVIIFPFCIATKEMTDTGNEGENTYKELFKIEEGWGYDISDFTISKDENWYNGKYQTS